MSSEPVGIRLPSKGIALMRSVMSAPFIDTLEAQLRLTLFQLGPMSYQSFCVGSVYALFAILAKRSKTSLSSTSGPSTSTGSHGSPCRNRAAAAESGLCTVVGAVLTENIAGRNPEALTSENTTLWS